MTTEMPNNQSPHGLRNDCLSYEAVIAQSILLLTPTAVPVNVLSLVFASAGNGTWLSFIIGMVGLLFVSFNINQFACRSASPGSLDSYIIKGLGPHVGVLCAWAAIALSGFIILIIPSVFKVYGYDTFELQNYFGIICSFGFLVMYILVSIAAPVYLFQLNKLKPIDVLFAILAVSFMILPFYRSRSPQSCSNSVDIL